jgi:hypothetical protein
MVVLSCDIGGAAGAGVAEMAVRIVTMAAGARAFNMGQRLLLRRLVRGDAIFVQSFWVDDMATRMITGRTPICSIIIAIRTIMYRRSIDFNGPAVATIRSRRLPLLAAVHTELDIVGRLSDERFASAPSRIGSWVG